MKTNKDFHKESIYSFANINLLGKCNANCYFCLGKDVEELMAKQNQLSTRFSEWENLDTYLDMCKRYGVKEIYLTGENTDPLIYKFLGELVDYIQDLGFNVGIRCNGYLAMKQMDVINRCKGEIGYSIHTLVPETNLEVMGRKDIPNWEEILKATNKCRVSFTVTRHNWVQMPNVASYLSCFPSVQYMQARCVVSETRQELVENDQWAFESLFKAVRENFEQIGDFKGTPIFNVHGTSVSMWNAWSSPVNSLNYFSDGTISESPYIIEGYMKAQEK